MKQFVLVLLCSLCVYGVNLRGKRETDQVGAADNSISDSEDGITFLLADEQNAENQLIQGEKHIYWDGSFLCILEGCQFLMHASLFQEDLVTPTPATMVAHAP